MSERESAGAPTNAAPRTFAWGKWPDVEDQNWDVCTPADV
jgi:hypothetical protein